VAQELIQGIDKGGRGLNIALNMDIKKAFDQLEWKFSL
jgi:hypothetical protein